MESVTRENTKNSSLLFVFKIRLENDPWKMFISEKTFLKYK